MVSEDQASIMSIKEKNRVVRPAGSSWFVEQDKLCEEAMRKNVEEFQENVEESMHWLKNYIGGLLGGQISSFEDMSMFLKTPATAKKPLKSNAAPDNRKEVAKNLFQEPILGMESSSTENDSKLQVTQHKTDTQVGSGSSEIDKSAASTRPNTSSSNYLSSSEKSGTVPSSSEPKSSTGGYRIGGHQDISVYLESVRGKLRNKLQQQSAKLSVKPLSFSNANTSINNTGNLSNVIDIEPKTSSNGPSGRKLSVDAAKDDAPSLGKPQIEHLDAIREEESDNTQSQEERLKDLISSRTEQLRKTFQAHTIPRPPSTANSDVSGLISGKDNSLKIDDSLSYSFIPAPKDQSYTSNNTSKILDDTFANAKPTDYADDNSAEDILPANLTSGFSSLQKQQDSYKQSNESSLSKSTESSISFNESAGMNEQIADPPKPKKAPSALDRVREALKMKRMEIEEQEEAMAQAKQSQQHASKSIDETKNPLLKNSNQVQMTPIRDIVTQHTPLSSPALDASQTILNKEGSEYSIPAIPSDDFYTDSDEENEKPQEKQHIPDWAKSPQLKAALRAQKRLNPDTIFGDIRPLKVEDIFSGNSLKRLRVRGSSANWSKDQLTQQEINLYKKKMGFDHS